MWWHSNVAPCFPSAGTVGRVIAPVDPLLVPCGKWRRKADELGMRGGLVLDVAVDVLLGFGMADQAGMHLPKQIIASILVFEGVADIVTGRSLLSGRESH
jgi:hypothetical protein